jgi:hypothetical protein
MAAVSALAQAAAGHKQHSAGKRIPAPSAPEEVALLQVVVPAGSGGHQLLIGEEVEVDLRASMHVLALE